jgi:uncharacterized protein
MKTNEVVYDWLLEKMGAMEIIDSHEHLPSERERLGKPPDFSLFFSHYCPDDLRSAGMPAADVVSFLADRPVAEKWRLFEPYYKLVQDGSYCRAAHLAMQKFYGMSELRSVSDAQALTDALRRANTAGLYQRVLTETCRIRRVMNFGDLGDDPRFFSPVLFCTQYVECTRQIIRGLEDRLGTTCGSLTSYVDAVREDLRRAKAAGMKGIKLHLAYMRDLGFAPQTHADAERVFLRLVEEGYGWRPTSVGYEEARPFQDYMVHRLIEMGIELDVPIVFHSAFQASSGMNMDDGRPSRLWNLPHRYRQARIVLLHSGMPWMEEAAVLAKHYPNVYLDMGWDHLMSPEISRRALAAWIDMLPLNKIFGFGGDYMVVEKVYGHLVLARQDLAAVLAHKVAQDGMSRERAALWCQALLFDNVNSVYKLGL